MESIDDKLTLVQVIESSCCPGTDWDLNPQGPHFADSVLKKFLLKENVCIFIPI